MKSITALLVFVILATVCRAQSPDSLEYLEIDNPTQLPALDDGISALIQIPQGLPFGASHPMTAWIATNGILSFGEPYSHWNPQVFPGTSSSVQNGYLIAPFWDDVDISGGGGSVYYQVFESADGGLATTNLDAVNTYVNSVHGDGNFNGVWMLLAMWDHVSPYPHGSFQSPIFYPDIYENNTFQAIVITDHTSKAYTIFTYKCGDLNWARGPTIGYNAASDFYANHPNTGADDADVIDCTNGPDTYYNVWYNISVENFVTPEPPTPVEPAQASYLQWLEHTGVNAGMVDACDDCSSSEINLPVDVPFGNYYHDSIYVATNGIISFGLEFPHFSASLFPTESATTYYDYAVAPYWADNDARLNGQVSWEMYSTGDSAATDTIIQNINNFINDNTNETNFAGNFVFVGFWEEMHPYPAGASETQAQPYLNHNNTYQGLIITNGTKTYAVFTYQCGYLNWAGEATIGFNAAADYYANHPLAGLTTSNLVACVHTTVGSEWNNVIYDLVPNPDALTTEPTPPPFNSIGTCAAAGITECCEGDNCLGSPQDCYCDVDCFFFNDCCQDIGDVCTFEPPPDTDYLLFASHTTINHIDFNGENFNILLGPLSGGAFGLDFHFSAGKMYWTDYLQDAIFRADFSGENVETVVDTQLAVPDDVAVDWVNNKLYWIDSLWARLEVMDISDGGNGERAELIKFSNHTLPRGIAVDPVSRLMFWTDWGEVAKVERASMDGKQRMTIISTGLGEPYGITIDYGPQRIYWADNDEDRIEFSDYMGGGRTVVVGAADGVVDPFGVTLYGNLLYWTDWEHNGVFGTHKVHGTDPIGNFTDVIEIHTGLLINPNGIEAISQSRQPAGDNPCVSNDCEHLCLLSPVADSGYSCACPLNYILNADGRTCSLDPNPTVPPINNGTCTAAGYTSCCEIGFCAGYPASCFCDYDCYQRGDCCHDTPTTCPQIVGSCIDAGYDTCCISGDCTGVPADANCYCDALCLTFDDCCEDFQQICPGGTPTTEPTANPPAAYLPYLDLSNTGVESIQLPQLDDGISGQIDIPDGLPFGNNHPIAAWIANNGIFSFNEAYSHWSPQVFPGTSSSVQNGYLVTPFWDDVDISGTNGGSIYYQVHSTGDNVPSNQLIDQVNTFINTVQDDSFAGVWMLVAMWDHVHPYPHGILPDPSINPDVNEENTFQAIVITDHTSQSYAVFTYKCGDLNWARSPTIGFNAASDIYENYDLTGSTNADIMDCFNSPTNDYFNLVYNISVENFVPPPPLPTSEPPQASYLQFLPHTGVNAGEVPACDDCSSSEISLLTQVPFGNYYHTSIYMATNGVISFGIEFPHFSASLFPTESAATYYDFALAPYWSDNDARLNGQVSWEMYRLGDGVDTDAIIQDVNAFINANTEETNFAGDFVFVGFWEEMHPYPAGASPIQAAPYLNNNNTYQAVVVTAGNKAYAVFTYKCGALNWAGEATIGYNAGGDYYMNHPLSGLSLSNAIACVHNDSEWNNVIYNLVPQPDMLTTDPTPVPPTTIGSCVAADYDSCCTEDSCLGEPQDCYCDTECFLFDDCCQDISEVCTFDLPTGDYLLFASHTTINHIDLNGDNFNIFIGQLSGGAYGLNFHYSDGYVYWTDYVQDTIYRANLSTGLNMEAVVNTNIPEPEDIAVDWVSNKLYWIDSLWARIEVMDVASGQRAELIRTSNHSIPRGIAVDPIAKYMFWTDWGQPSLVEKASMDGKAREVLHSVGINQPLGITCDYGNQRVYWTDAAFDRIEYSFYDGSGRTVLVSGSDGVQIPFDLTIYGDLLYWTDWSANAVYGTHKIHGTDPLGNLTTITVIYESLPVNPNGIEAITPNRQPAGENTCETNLCQHICLLSAVGSDGQSCVCQSGYILNEDQRTCSVDPNPTSVPTNNGSCVASGYSDCCEVGFCAGYPANCFCDEACYGRGDCCNDITSTCLEIQGSCIAAGYDTCCTDGFCVGEPEEANCYCDSICLTFGDCCSDFEEICPGGTPTTEPTVQPPAAYLPYLPLGDNGVTTNYLPTADDGVSAAITVPSMPFGNSIQTSAWMANNGIFSFGEAYSHWSPQVFPGTSSSVQNGYLITPFWDDNDIRREGSIYYETHQSGSNVPSNMLLQNVSSFISAVRDVSFSGTWMLVGMWDHVHPYPHGISTNIDVYPDLFENNTFQGIVITDGSSSYAVFTFKCGDLNWARSPTIGYNAASDYYENYELTGSTGADVLDCHNFPTSDYFNLVYNISVENIVTTPPPVTEEPPQASYLQWLEHTGVNAGVVDACDDCSSSEINLPVNVPFGNYYHESIYLGTNGVVSFGLEFPTFSPALFPTGSIETYYDYAAAPYWADNDARLNGQVSWEMYSTGDSPATDDIIQDVTTFIRENTEDATFAGSFMFVGFWEGMHPYPAGSDPSLATPYLESNNTYQAIIITDGEIKTYAIYTFKCGSLNWAGEATIGFNAGGDYYENHYLSGLPQSNAVACVHINVGSEWNNVIYNLVPSPGDYTGQPTPEPPSSLGSCADAGYTTCCEEGDCIGGDPFDCYCDQFCYFLDDCCYDIEDICTPVAPDDSNYLLFANHFFINRVNLDGSDLAVVLGVDSGGAAGIQFNLAQNKMYYTDYINNHIYSATLNNGSNIQLLLNDSVEVPEDLAFDWVTNNLYWSDSFWARIEVMDLDTGERAELIRTGTHSIPRAIIVDPVTRYMYWTDWGEVAKVEKAGMDGQGRTVLVNTDLIWPNGLAIDYATQIIYWADANLDKIEYSYTDGSGRTLLETGATGLLHPYALTIDGDLLYWTDWQNNSIYATHKVHGVSQDGDINLIVDNLVVNPNGIEAITADKQPDGVNMCENNVCSHLCLLSVVDPRNYSCACPLGTELANDGTSCITTSTSTPLPEFGSCTAAGYSDCCETGYCAGYPANCFCDRDCHARGDCCSDINDICIDYTSYLLFANHFFILRVNLDGTNPLVLITQFSGGAAGIDFDLTGDKMFYSDFVTNQILMANLDGTNIQELLNDQVEVPESLALDWVGNNLYWTDSFWARIEVMDLNTTERAEVLRTGENTVPRGIAVDPVNRYVYWTDWGTTAKIERASMDGQNRVALIDTDLVWPNDITIDYAAQKLYWIDANLNKVESSNMDGSGRVTLTTNPEGFGLGTPYSLTLEGDYLYWSEWNVNTIFSVHKNGGNVSIVLQGLILNPNGIQVVGPSRRPYGENTCASNDCTHLCLLSSANPNGYTCACPIGMELDNDGVSCVMGTATPLPEFGSCSHYSDCCDGGYCAGYPPNCFCDHDCHSRGDCCRDVADICPEFEGSCIAAGYDTCCTSGLCIGEPDVGNCFCDIQCLQFGDCCDDFFEICPDATPPPTTTTVMPTSTSTSTSTPTSTSTSTTSTSTSTTSTSTSTTSTSTTSMSSSSTSTPRPTGTPADIVYFQLYFRGLQNCSDWTGNNTQGKIDSITTQIVQGTESLCSCQLQSSQVVQARFQCDEENDKTTVTFRAILYGNDGKPSSDILDFMLDWLRDNEEFIVENTTLKRDGQCPLKIESFDDKTCAETQSQTGGQTGSNAAAVAAPVVIILIAVAAAVVVGGVAVFLFLKRRRGKSYDIFGDEAEVGIINDGDHEETPGGATLTSVKKEALAFEKAADVPPPPSSQQPTGGRSFQNPIYGTADLSSPGTEEKPPLDTEAKLPPPDTTPPPSAPLKTDTVATPPGSEYEPSKAAPKVEEEPRYATVLPKHKRATAKPFAGDEGTDDEDDEV